MKKLFLTVSILFSMGYIVDGMAHSGGGTMNPGGNNAHFTALAQVTCYDDGNGEPHHLFARIKDQSVAIPGHLISLHIINGHQATSTTDPVSGDTPFSPGIDLQGASDTYTLMVTITGDSPRTFIADWHCEAENGTHTGTDDIIVRQFQ